MKRYLAAIIIVLIILVAGLPLVLPQEQAPDYSAYNGSTKGLSAFREEADNALEVKAIATSPCELDEVAEPSEALYVAVAMTKKYTAVELASVVDFIESGGRVLLADDSGYGYQLADAITEASPEGATLSFSGSKVYSSDGCPMEAATLRLGGEGGVRHPVPLSSPTAVFAHGGNIEVVSQSGQDDFADWDGDGRADIGEVGSVPLAASFTLGAGRGLILGDPDLLTNGAMEGMPANFTSDLLSWLLPDGGTVYFDESRHPRDSGAAMDAYLMGMAIATSRSAVTFLFVAVAAVAGAIVLLSRSDPAPWSHRFDLHGYRRPPKRLFAGTRDALAEELLARIEDATGRSPSEIKSASDAELLRVTGDPMLVNVIKGRGMTSREIENSVEKIRKWKHG